MKISDPLAKDLALNLVNKDIQIVVIESAYDQMESAQLERLLWKMFQLKLRGYRSEYNYGVLPIDTYDFVGYQLIACERTKQNELNPILGFKSISLDRCKIHNLEFPAYHLLGHGKYHNHRAAIDQEVSLASHRNESMHYAGSLTFHEDYRKDPLMKQLAYDLSIILFVHFYLSYQVSRMVTASTLRFKMDRFHDFLGFEKLKFNSDVLPSIPCEPFFDEPISLVRYPGTFSEQSKKLAERYAELWENKIVIPEGKNRFLASESLKKAA